MRIGVDVGGTTTSGVLLDHRQHIVESIVMPTQLGHDGVVATVSQVVQDLQGSRPAKERSLAGIGIGIPGAVDVLTGTVSHAINLRLDQLRIGPIIANEFGTPVAIDNDVNAAALGFVHWMRHNEGRPVESLTYVNLGTGLAAGFVFGGEVWRGHLGISGEIGHIPIDPNGPRCVCGMRGCIETVVSAARLDNESAALGLTTMSLAHEAATGNPAARQLWDAFSVGVANAVRLLILTVGVDVVAIGGGLAGFGEPLLDSVARVFDDWSQISPFLGLLNVRDRLRLVPIEAKAGATGASLLVKKLKVGNE